MVDDLEESPVPSSCVYLSDEGVEGGGVEWSSEVERGKIYEGDLIIEREVAVFVFWAMLWELDEGCIDA